MNLYEKKALFRCVLAAKFSHQSIDEEIYFSKHVSNAVGILVDEIRQLEIEKWGAGAADEWGRWEVSMGPRNSAWKGLIRMAAKLYSKKWNQLSDDEKMAQVKILFSPFSLNQDAAVSAIFEINELIEK